MANQPPTTRPWFRLTNLARQGPPPAPAPAPAPQAQIQPPAAPLPRVPIIRPAFRPTFTQPQPAPPPPTAQSQPPTAPSSPRPSTALPPSLRPATSPPPPPPPPSVEPASPTPPPPSPPPPPPIVSRSPPHPPPPHTTSSPATEKMSPKPAVISMELPPPSFNSVTTSSPPKSSSYTDTTVAGLPSAIAPALSAKPLAQITPPQSPVKTTRSPPSPFILPPQLKSSKEETESRIAGDAVPKRVLIQETFKKPVVNSGASKGDQVKGSGDAYIKSSKHGKYKEGSGYKKFSSDSDDGGNVRIVTISGENKGAFMDLGFSPKRNGGINGYHARSHHLVGDVGELEDGYTASEDRSKIKDRKENATSSHLPMNAYMNSNVQGVNNSILCDCSCTHHDPGVHFSLSRKLVSGKGNGHGIYHKDHAKGKQV